MSAPLTGELVWVRKDGKVSMGVYVKPKDRAVVRSSTFAKLSNLKVPILAVLPRQNVVYRQSVQLKKEGDGVTVGPVFAILTSSGPSQFLGSRANFRDVIETARKQNTFVYVLPDGQVNDKDSWYGYVRLGYQRWIRILCPHPEAIYNRIPNRNLERSRTALNAKGVLQRYQIPMFNPEYFNKAKIYEMIRTAQLQRFLPDTADVCTATGLRSMLARHKAVYLKPAGGSVGHGMIRITRSTNHFQVAVLKNARCQILTASGFPDLWGVVQRQRLPGHYVIQEAIPLIEWQGRPCDFRLLLQKRGGAWHVVGKGVRVSGADTITTHVPNGGYIASASRVLHDTFTSSADEVEATLDTMAVSCAEAIDGRYQAALGEMSMDIGVDKGGELWFFEANAKPMKFDESDIRQRSLTGILTHLEELRKSTRR